MLSPRQARLRPAAGSGQWGAGRAEPRRTRRGGRKTERKGVHIATGRVYVVHEFGKSLLPPFILFRQSHCLVIVYQKGEIPASAQMARKGRFRAAVAPPYAMSAPPVDRVGEI